MSLVSERASDVDHGCLLQGELSTLELKPPARHNCGVALKQNTQLNRKALQSRGEGTIKERGKERQQNDNKK